MSLLDDLLSIDNKPYQPVYSGKLLNPFRLKTFNDNENLHRPKTASSFALLNNGNKSTSSKTKTATSSNTNVLINRPTTAKSRSSNGSAFNANKKSTSRKVELMKKPYENDERSKSDDNNEDDSQSCNLSLLSLSTGRCSQLAHETRVEFRKQYGKFRYTSFFERYMNQRATIKIPSHFIPKISPDIDNKPLPSLYELLDSDELDQIFSMYDVTVALPPRVRSNSVPRKAIQSRFHRRRRRRSASQTLRSFDTKSQSKSHDHDSNSKEDSSFKPDRSLIFEEEANEHDYNARAITAPYMVIRNDKKNVSKKPNETTATSRKNRPYSYVDSKLGPYLSSKMKRPVYRSETSKIYTSKSAIRANELFKKPYLTYENVPVNRSQSFGHKSSHTESYLKLNDYLETMIRSDLKSNKGPIYFEKLSEENLLLHNGRKTSPLTRADKFLFIYEWLNRMNEHECAPVFFSNPFVLDKEVTVSIDQSYSSNSDEALTVNNEPVSVGIGDFGLNTQLKIDPFNNPKNDKTVDKLPKRHLTNLNTAGFYETQDKQTIFCNRDYKSFLRMNGRFLLNSNANMASQTTGNIHTDVTTGISPARRQQLKERLQKSKILNDILLTRVELDLYIL